MRETPGKQPGVNALDPDARLASVDILRGLALFGVLAVNLVTEFRVSIFEQFLPLERAHDGVETFIRYVLEMKAFALFSLLFGFGLGLQYERLRANGEARYRLVRRLFILLAFGLIHLLLIWNGDILTEYALAGLVVLPLLGLPSAVLALFCVMLFALYVALPYLPPVVPFPDTAWITQHIALAERVYGSGSMADTIGMEWRELRYLLPLHVYVLPRTLALFLLGALMYRAGVVQRARKLRAIISVVTVVSLIGGGLACGLGSPSGLGSVPLAVGFAGAVLLVLGWSPARRALGPFGALGRMAFTNYIMQSLLAGWVFFGYGLGWFARRDAATVLILAVAIYAFQLWLSQAWLQRYYFGPLEWLWRTLTYGRMQPLKKRQSPDVMAL
jgi:uncharacterized protein